MLTVLKNRNFTLLWLGGLISMMGNWTLFVALPIYVYESTGSTLATGLMFMAGTLPRLLLGSVAGVFVDRWERKRTMVVCNLLLALALVPLAVVPTTGWFWLVYLVSLLESAVAQFFSPAENALLPTLIGKEHLVPANALNALNNNLARLIGPAVGGLIMGLAGLQAVVVLDAATYLLAAVLIAFITVTSRASDKKAQISPPASEALSTVVREWLEGLGTVKQSGVITLLFVIIALTRLGEGVFAVLLVPFVTEVLRGDALQLGWLMSAQAVGGLVGGVVVGWLGARVLPAYLLGLGSLFLGLIDLVIFNYPVFLPGIALALILMVIAGAPASSFGAGFQTLIQTYVPDRFMGRVFGAIGTSGALLQLIGMAVASILGDVLGILPVINIQGVVYVLGGIIALTLLKRQLLKTVTDATTAVEGQGAF